MLNYEELVKMMEQHTNEDDGKFDYVNYCKAIKENGGTQVYFENIYDCQDQFVKILNDGHAKVFSDPNTEGMQGVGLVVVPSESPKYTLEDIKSSISIWLNMMEKGEISKNSAEDMLAKHILSLLQLQK